MRKTFKSKKRTRRLFKLRYLLFIGIIYLSFDTTYAYLLDKKTNIENDNYLKMILSDTNHHFTFDYKPRKIISGAITLLSKIDLTKPSSLLSINSPTYNAKAAIGSGGHSDNYNPEEQEKITEFIKDPNPATVTRPRVYVYNSHQLENYNPKNFEIYNISPNVMMASYLLKEKLNDLGIPTIVNEFNLNEFIRINNWVHGDSYKASRIFILDAKNKYDTLEYYIDIHRDSIKKAASTIKIGGKNYARILFVVGLDNSNYGKNLSLANALHKKIEAKYPGLSRGVLKKQGKGVDGVYNQDISSKVMLIEIGGYQNTFEEVMCTVEALSKVLYDYIGGKS
ncbi:MAG: stage II sporulation protein P [Bacilli bacterium]|nr:stage II sporulation protein P [Bacilli bacterium]MDD4298515.1 stage II sporulation protein P [Bacilli bacterium]MDD4643855.1 stage II sporulation protein P [Bacilli bacterium]